MRAPGEAAWRRSEGGATLLASVLAATGLSACRPPPSVACSVPHQQPFAVGAKFRLALLDIYQSGSKFVFDPALDPRQAASGASCQGSDGLAVGSEVDVEVTDTRFAFGQCFLTRASVSAPTSIPTLTGSGDPSAFLTPGTALFGAGTIARPGACTATWGFAIEVADLNGSPLASSVAGQKPAVVLNRFVVPDCAGNGCSDTFVVQVSAF